MEPLPPAAQPLRLVPKPNPQIFAKYKKADANLWVNLFKIEFKKDLLIYQYPYKLTLVEKESDEKVKKRIYYAARKDLINIYGPNFQSGDSIYGLNFIQDRKDVTFDIIDKGEKISYVMTLQPCAKKINLSVTDASRETEIEKMAIECIMKDIYSSNRNLELWKNTIVDISEQKDIKSIENTIQFTPGYKTAYMKTEIGPFLVVSIKNKIMNPQTILDEFKLFGFSTTAKKEEIRNYYCDKVFKTTYSSKPNIIFDIDFERNPKNSTINKDNKTITLMEYYESCHEKTIQDETQPLIVVGRNEKNKTYFIPELCHMLGLGDKASDHKLMQNMATITKLEPKKVVEKLNKFVNLSQNDDHKNTPEKDSAKQKAEKYGFSVAMSTNKAKGIIMKDTDLIIRGKGKVFKVEKAINLTTWLFVYQQRNYHDAESLYNTMVKASKGLGIRVNEPEWIEMSTNDPKDWTNQVNAYMNRKKYQFVLFLLFDKFEKCYAPLKIDSLVNKGYFSQVVKVSSLKKNLMSVCSKILYQINSKLGGYSYLVRFDKEITDKKLMIVGIDFSHVPRKGTGVAMVSTINKEFTEFFNSEQIILEEKREQLEYSVSKFLEQAVNEYFKNKMY